MDFDAASADDTQTTRWGNSLFAQFAARASIVSHWEEQTAAYENYVKLDALRALFR